MTCKDAQDQLLLRQSGEADEGNLQALKDHLATCSDCRQLAEEYEALSQTLQNHRLAVSAPTELRDRLVREAIRQQSRPARSILRLFPALSTAAVLFLAIGLWMRSPQTSATRPSPEAQSRTQSTLPPLDYDFGEPFTEQLLTASLHLEAAEQLFQPAVQDRQSVPSPPSAEEAYLEELRDLTAELADLGSI